MNFRLKKKKETVVHKLDICNSFCQHWLLPIVRINFESNRTMNYSCPVLMSHSALFTCGKILLFAALSFVRGLQ